MRKLMVLPLAGLLALGVVGPVAAAPNVSNTSGSGENRSTASGRPAATYGYISVGEDSAYGGFVDIYQESGTWVECDTGAADPGKGTPTTEDTTGGDYGFVGTQNLGVFGRRPHGRSLTQARQREGDRHGQALHRDRRRMRRRLWRRCRPGGRHARRERLGGETALFIPRPRQLQGPIPVQCAPERPRQGTSSNRDGLGRHLNPRYVQRRGHERVDLVGPQQRLTPLTFVRRTPGSMLGASSCLLVQKRKRVMSAGKTDQANALTGRSSHSPPCVQLSGLAS